MPKTKRRPGRAAERFQFSHSWQEIATRVSRKPKPKPPEGWPTLSEPAKPANKRQK